MQRYEKKLKRTALGSYFFSRRLLTHAKVCTLGIVDDATGMITIEARRTDNEIGHIERQETVTIETTRIALWQHEGLGDDALGIHMTEIRSREETIVTT